MRENNLQGSQGLNDGEDLTKLVGNRIGARPWGVGFAISVSRLFITLPAYSRCFKVFLKS